MESMKYFTINELCRSNTAQHMGIRNEAPAEARNNLTALTLAVLDPLREAWGSPISVNSGYRCKALNKAVGGSPTSHHLRGMAADITTGNRVDNRRLFQLVQNLGLKFTQLIDESDFRWIHISYDSTDLRGEILKL